MQVEVLSKKDGVARLSTVIRRLSDDALILSGEAEVLAPTERHEADVTDLPGLIVERHRHFESLLAKARPLPALRPPSSVRMSRTRSAGRCSRPRKASSRRYWSGTHPPSEPPLRHGVDLEGFEIVDVAGDGAAAAMACQLVHSGRAAAVMKGHLHTDDLFETDARQDAGPADRATLHPCLRDGRPRSARPDHRHRCRDQHRARPRDQSGYLPERHRSCAVSRMDPRVGVLSAVETVNPAIQSSIDAALLSKMQTAARSRAARSKGRSPWTMRSTLARHAPRAEGPCRWPRQHPRRAGPRCRQHAGQATGFHEPRRRGRARARRARAGNPQFAFRWPHVAPCLLRGGGPPSLRQGDRMTKAILTLNAGSSSLKAASIPCIGARDGWRPLLPIASDPKGS